MGPQTQVSPWAAVKTTRDNVVSTQHDVQQRESACWMLAALSISFITVIITWLTEPPRHGRSGLGSVGVGALPPALTTAAPARRTALHGAGTQRAIQMEERNIWPRLTPWIIVSINIAANNRNPNYQ